MSQTMEHVSSPMTAYPSEEFTYRPVPPLAPVTLFLGIFAATSLLTVLGLGFAVFGIALGTVCLARIRKARGDLGGKLITQIGLALSVVFLFSGAAYHRHVYVNEVPEGYTRTSFNADISKKGLLIVEGVPEITPEVKALNGKKIFIKGYMYPVRQTTGLTSFVLVKDSGECCFGGQPKETDMILVKMRDGQTVDYLDGLVAVAGVFQAKGPQQAGELKPIYEMEGTHFSQARTSF